MRWFVLLLAGCPYIGDKAADIDGDGLTGEQDCVEGDDAVHADAVELCDGKDNDCNGVIDDEPIDVRQWYADDDNDGYGAGDAVAQCENPGGRVDNADDCNDDSSDVHPGAERCLDHVADNDCDGDDDGCRPLGTYPEASQVYLELPDPPGEFGMTLAPGDLNGDGTLDLLVSDWSEDSGSALHFVRGDGNRTFREPIPFDTGVPGLEAVGYPLYAAQDFSFDGQNDIAIGAAGYTAPGAVILLEDPSESSLFVLSPGNESDYFGSSISGVQVDGENRLVVGAPGYSDSLQGASVVYVLYNLELGAAGAINNARTLLSFSYSIGSSVVGLNNPTSSSGRIAFDGREYQGYGQRVWVLPADGDTVVVDGGVDEIAGAWEIHFPPSDFWLYLSAAGDVDGDGWEDLAVGDPGSSAIHIFRLNDEGGVITPEDAWATLWGTEETLIGPFLQRVDLDGDSISDLAFLAYTPDAEGYPGEIFVAYGPFSAGEYDATDMPHVSLGTGVSPNNLGDLDGDGFEDVGVGTVGFEDLAPEDRTVILNFGYGN